MNSARILEESYTIEDIYNLQQGERAELIDGQIYFMAPPNTRHQRFVHFLDRIIGNYIQDKNGQCEVFPAPFAVFLNKNAKNYVEPDLSIICYKEKITDKGCNGAPDWIIEVVSPASRQMDYYKKLFKYRAAGVREYWVIDPDKQIVTVYNFESDHMEEYSLMDSIKVGIYEDLIIDFSAFMVNGE